MNSASSEKGNIMDSSIEQNSRNFSVNFTSKSPRVKNYNELLEEFNRLQSKYNENVSKLEKENALLLEKVEKYEGDKIRFTLDLTDLVEEKNRLAKELKVKSDLIHRYISNLTIGLKTPDMKLMSKTYKTFRDMEQSLSLCKSDIVNIMGKMQGVEQTCNECRKRYHKEKEEDQIKIQHLENDQVNNRFIIQQQCNEINELKPLKQEIEKLKKEVLSLRKEIVSRKDNIKWQKKIDTVKEKKDVPLPPTPDSWCGSRDNEDSFCSLSNNTIFTTDDSFELLHTEYESQEMKKEHQFGEHNVLKSINKQDTLSKEENNLERKELKIDKDLCLESDKSVGAENRSNEKSPITSNKENVEINLCTDKNSQELLNIFSHEKDMTSLSNKELNTSKNSGGEILSSEENGSKKSYVQNLSNSPKETPLTADNRDVKVDTLPTLVEKPQVDRNIRLTKENKDDFETFSSPLETSEKLSEVCPTALQLKSFTSNGLSDHNGDDNNVTLKDSYKSLKSDNLVRGVQISEQSPSSYSLFENISPKSLVDSEGWSPPINNFEAVCHGYLQLPEAISPLLEHTFFRTPENIEDEMNFKSDIGCNENSALHHDTQKPAIVKSENLNPFKSIFSPEHNNKPIEYSKFHEKITEVSFDLGDDIKYENSSKTSHQNITLCDKTDEFITVPGYKIENTNGKQLICVGNVEEREPKFCAELTNLNKAIDDKLEVKPSLNFSIETKKISVSDQISDHVKFPNYSRDLINNHHEDVACASFKNIAHPDTDSKNTQGMCYGNIHPLTDDIKPIMLKDEKISTKFKKSKPNLTKNIKPSITDIELTSEKLNKLCEGRISSKNSYLKSEKSELSSECFGEERCMPLDLSLCNDVTTMISRPSTLKKEIKGQSCFGLEIPNNSVCTPKINCILDLSTKRETPLNSSDIKPLRTSNLPIPKVPKSPDKICTLKLPTGQQKLLKKNKTELLQMSGLSLKSGEEFSKLEALSPDTTSNLSIIDVNRHLSQSYFGDCEQKASRDKKPIADSYSPDYLFHSPPQQIYETSPQVSLRSPTAMKHYNLRLSPKISKSIQYSVKSPKKSDTSHSPKSTNKNIIPSTNKGEKYPENKNLKHSKSKILKSPNSLRVSPKLKKCHNSPPTLKPKKSGQISKSYSERNTLCLSPKCCKGSQGIQTPPRSPESIKHYNMRTNLSPKKCSHCNSPSCLGNQLKPTTEKHKELLDPEKLTKFKESSAFTTSTNSQQDVLSDIQMLSLKEDSVPLNVKLRQTVDERMDVIKTQEHLTKPVSISVNSSIMSGLSVTVDQSSKERETHSTIPQEVQQGLRVSFGETSTDYKSGANDLVMTVDKVENSSLVTNTISKEDHSASDLIRQRYRKIRMSRIISPRFKNLHISYSRKKHVLNTSRSACEMGLTDKVTTTVSEEDLFRDTDMTYKSIGYSSNLFTPRKKLNNDLRIQISEVQNNSETEEHFNKHKRLRLAEVAQKCSKSFKLTEAQNSMEIKSVEKLNLAIPNKSSERYTGRHMDVNICDSLEIKTNIGRKQKLKSNVESSHSKSLGDIKSPSSIHNHPVEELSLLNKHDLKLAKVILHRDPIIDKLTTSPIKNITTNYSSENSEPSLGGKNLKLSEIELSEDTDCLIIDIDEELMNFTEPDTNLLCVENGAVPSSSEVSTNSSCNRNRRDISNNNTSFVERVEKDSVPENRTSSGQASAGLGSTSPAGGDVSIVNNEFFPKFYIEYRNSDVDNSNQVHSSQREEVNTNETEVRFQNHVFKKKTLDELILKGKKIEVEENILRTAFKKHSENLPNYIEQNVSRQQHTNQVSGKHVNEVVAIVEPILKGDLRNRMDVLKCVNRLVQFEPCVILKGFITALYNLAVNHQVIPSAAWIFGEKIEQRLPNKKSPPLHPRIQAAVLLLVLVNDIKMTEKNQQEKNKYLEEEFNFIELAFHGATEFNDTLPSFWLQLAYVYTALARKYGLLLRVRQFLYDLLYGFAKRSLSVAYAVLQVWPAVLPVKPIQSYRDDPLGMVIIYCLTTVAQEPLNRMRCRHYVQQLHKLLWHKYRFRADTVNREELFHFCLSRLGQPGVSEAVVLLAKRQNKEWFMKQPKQQLMAVIEEWRTGKCGDVRAIEAINTLCSSLRAYNCAEIQYDIQPLFKLFEEILAAENTQHWMQEVIVWNICRLSRLNYNVCLDLVQGWRPSQVSMEIIDQILVNFISKRPPVWWASNNIALSYLNAR